ncbi:MAG TPA: arginine--tRNA ligase [Nitrososphaeraceae archaeon]
MTFRAGIEEIRTLIANYLRTLGIDEVKYDVMQTPRTEFGDLTTNVSFLIAKKTGLKPSDIARKFVESQIKLHIDDCKSIGKSSLIESAYPHPAGYINFKLNTANIASSTLTEILGNPHYAEPDIGNGKSVIIEHTSVNPNKALHIGHVRNLVIGDTLYRLLRITNYNPIVLNYVDDSGLQVADLVVGFLFAGFPTEANNSQKFDIYCGDEVYVKVNELYTNDQDLAERRRFVLKEIELGQSDVSKFASDISRRVLSEQLKTCWRLKARYDLLSFESHILASNQWNKTFEMLKNKGVLVLETEGKNRNCWIIRSNVTDDKIVVRSDGTATYVAKDIPYALWKLGLISDYSNYFKFSDQWDNSTLWATTLETKSDSGNHPKFNSAELAITIIDSRQSKLQDLVSYVIYKLMGTNAKEYRHLGYEPVTLSSTTAKMLGLDIGKKDFAHMSGRKGVVVYADYVLDILHRKALEEIKKRRDHSEESLMQASAEDIAISALRYNLIKQDLDKMITFDITESLSLEGDTGPYLQYAYARSQRILEKSCVEISNINFSLLSEESETSLLMEMSKLDIVMEDAAKNLNPKILARYAYKLAVKFNLFYEKSPVLREANPEKVVLRLALVKSFEIVMKKVFEILGMAAMTMM